MTNQTTDTALVDAKSPVDQPPQPSTPAQRYLASVNGCASQEWQDGFNEAVRITLAGAEAGCHKLDTPSHVFFYEQDFYVLSNFSAFSLQWKGRRFDTSEAAYHWEKFDGTCPEVQDMILEAPSAHAAFKLAESQKCFRRHDWDDIRLDVMRDILREKAAQHEYVRRKLLATGERTLVEDSWRDDFWGWGPNRNGQNWLGRLWMEVRFEIAGAK